jgi:hypothetical protein
VEKEELMVLGALREFRVNLEILELEAPKG